jgi:hypothetical protein
MGQHLTCSSTFGQNREAIKNKKNKKKEKERQLSSSGM